ncbi:MAG: hypothetical protein HOO96_18585 [Polyangiaceae bacterium]|nr:hypothetical protein [Polyangiaceae bacterium]
MNRRLALAFSLSVAAVTSACGQTLDLGKDVPAGCEGKPAGARILSTLAELPDFVPLSMVVVGNAAYVGGYSLPGRSFANASPETRDIGRLVRVPLDGGLATEVWRGTWFRSPLKVQGARIVFTEYDPANTSNYPVFGGVDVYDSATSAAAQIPNVPGRDYVVDFEVVPDGVVFSSATFLSNGGSTMPGYSVARASFADLRARSFFEHPTQAPLFLRRGETVLASMLADGSESGYDDPTSQALDLAMFAVDATGLRLERRLTELMSPRTATSAGMSYAVVYADDTAYYVAETAQQYTTTQRLPRAARTNAPESVVSGSLGRPRFFGREVLWTPATDRSMVRARAFDGTDNRNGTELAFDARRQIVAFAPDACGVTWVSYSSDGDSYRVMSAPRL